MNTKIRVFATIAIVAILLAGFGCGGSSDAGSDSGETGSITGLGNPVVFDVTPTTATPTAGSIYIEYDSDSSTDNTIVMNINAVGELSDVFGANIELCFAGLEFDAVYVDSSALGSDSIVTTNLTAGKIQIGITRIGNSGIDCPAGNTLLGQVGFTILNADTASLSTCGTNELYDSVPKVISSTIFIDELTVDQI